MERRRAIASFVPCMTARRSVHQAHSGLTSPLQPPQNSTLLQTVQRAIRDNHLGHVLNLLTANPQLNLPQGTIDEIAAKLRLRGLHHRAHLLSKRLNLPESLTSALPVSSLASQSCGTFDHQPNKNHPKNATGTSFLPISLHLQTLIEHRQIDEAITILQKPETQDVSPIVLSSLVAVATADGQVKKAHIVFTELYPKFRMHPTGKDYSLFIKAAGRVGSLHRALSLLDTPSFALLPKAEKSEVMCLLVESCIKSNDVCQADSLLSRMRSLGVPITDNVYVTTLQANQHTLSMGKKLCLLNDIRQNGNSQLLLAAYNAILLGAARAARIDDAFDVFKSMTLTDHLTPDVTTYNNLLMCCAKAGNPDRAMRLLEMMTNNTVAVRPNAKSYNYVVAACARVGDVSRALEIARRMPLEGIRLNIVTNNHLLEAYCNAGRLERAFAMAKDMIQHQGIKPNSHTYDTLIRGCGRWGQLDAALRLLSSMQSAGVFPTVITYSVAIDACARAGGPVAVDRAFELLRKMERAGLEPNVVTFNSLIHACSQGKKVQLAFDVFNGMVKAGVTPDLVTLCSLVDVCGRAQDFDKAFSIVKVFLQRYPRLKPTVPVYNAIMHACFKAGDFDRMLSTFQEMQNLRLRPSIVTFSTLISAFSSVGNMEAALSFMDDMKTYGLRPSRQLFTSIIAAYGRSGEVEKAMSMLKKAQTLFGEPDEELYTAAIVAAVGGGRKELAVVLASEMSDAGYVVPTVLNSFMRRVGDVERSGAELRRVLSAMEALNIRPQRAALEALIATYVKEVDVTGAFGVLPDMKRLGYLPNIQTFKKLIQVCTLSGKKLDIIRAQKLFDMVRERVRNIDPLLTNHGWRELYEALLHACDRLPCGESGTAAARESIIRGMTRDCGQSHVDEVLRKMTRRDHSKHRQAGI